MRKMLFTFLCSLVVVCSSYGQQAEQVVTFKFVPGNDMFYVPWGGNGAERERLYSFIDQYRSDILAKRIPVYVDGYCASLPTSKENLKTAFIRANRVKSDLIVHKGLLEEHFSTRNFASAYDGRKDLVVVTLRIPAPQPKPEVRPAEPRPRPEPRPEPKPEPEPEPEPEPQLIVRKIVKKAWEDPYCFAVRTNLLYDAFLTPTLGVEWRINSRVGVKVDGSFSNWGSETGKIQKVWLVSPEVRWYMGDLRRLYLGLGANYGDCDIYKGMLGSLVSKETGYKGTLFNGGVTVGYQLPVVSNLLVDFNIGLGYTNLKYDTYGIINNTRVPKAYDVTREIWGPTQAGVSLVWRLGEN